MRACRELGSKRAGVAEGEPELEVVNCSRGWAIETMTERAFFTGYKRCQQQQEQPGLPLEGEGSKREGALAVGSTGEEEDGDPPPPLGEGGRAWVGGDMLKVRDWPSNQSFSQRLVRHNQVGRSV